MSERQLKRTIRELVAINEALSERLALFVTDHEDTVAELTEKNKRLEEHLTEAVEDAKRYEQMWEREFARTKSAEERAKESDKELGSVKHDLLTTRLALAGVQSERDQARAHAETMRRIAYPDQPQFPWEKPAAPVGPHDPQTGMWRGN